MKNIFTLIPMNFNDKKMILDKWKKQEDEKINKLGGNQCIVSSFVF